MWLLLVMVLSDAPATAPASEPLPVETAAVAPASEQPASGPTELIAAPVLAEAPASKPVSTEAAPAKRTTVSAAVNADQAALSGAIAKPWSVVLSFNTSMGLGTFVSNPNAGTAYVGSSLSIEPAYVFSLSRDFRVRVSARESLSLEFTPPDDPNGRRFEWSDLLLGASARLYKIPVIDVDLWASFRFPIPLSMQSIQAGLVTAVVPGVGASHNFDWAVNSTWRMSLTVRYDFVFRKNFHVNNVPVYRTVDDPYAPTLITRANDTLTDGGIGRGVASTSFTFSNAITVSFNPWDFVSLSLFASIGNGFKYPITEAADFYTSSFATPGAGRFDTVRTNIDLTFIIMPQIMLSAGVFNSAPPFAPDNRTVYNPFVNPSLANNFTQVYVSLTSVL